MEITSIPSHHFENLESLEKGHWWYRGRLEWAKDIISQWNKTQRSISYIDVGGGTGGFAKEIKNAFNIKRVAVVDSHSAALEKLHAKDSFEVFDANLEKEIPVPWEPNLITCMDVIEHIKYDQAVLNLIAKKLAPGGLLILSVPAFPFLYSNWDKQLGHYRRYRRGTLEKKLKKAGLRLQDSSYAWSILFPFAPYRWLSPAKQTELELPKVKKPINDILILLSKIERKVSRVLGMPFGTSVMVSAVKG